MPNRLWLTLVSLWVWLVFGVSTLVMLPVMLLLYLITLWKDPGRYLVGRAFRQIGVLTAKTIGGP